MSGPTKAELQEQLAEARAEEKRAKENLAGLDSEARAYHRCYAALSKLEGSFTMGKRSPDTKAISRVIESLQRRFGLDETDQTFADTYFEPHMESTEDPRDQIIAQLIEGLRKA